jgi:hypothetical protein
LPRELKSRGVRDEKEQEEGTKEEKWKNARAASRTQIKHNNVA